MAPSDDDSESRVDLSAVEYLVAYTACARPQRGMQRVHELYLRLMQLTVLRDRHLGTSSTGKEGVVAASSSSRSASTSDSARLAAGSVASSNSTSAFVAGSIHLAFGARDCSQPAAAAAEEGGGGGRGSNSTSASVALEEVMGISQFGSKSCGPAGGPEGRGQKRSRGSQHPTGDHTARAAAAPAHGSPAFSSYSASSHASSSSSCASLLHAVLGALPQSCSRARILLRAMIRWWYECVCSFYTFVCV